MDAGRFGQFWLFLPFLVSLGIPYLHGAKNLARKGVEILVAGDKG